jgi:cytochrome c oxidase subunit 5a
MSASLLRVAVRGPSSFLRANLVVARPQPMVARAAFAAPSFSTSSRMRSEHQEETFEEFSAR